MAILFPNSLRTALEIWLSGIPRRLGYGGHFRSWLLNQIAPDRGIPGPIEHQADRYLRMARELGASVADKERLFSTAGAIDNRLSLISGATEARLKIGLSPGAEYGLAKRWLPERFAEVAKAVTAQSSVQWTLFGYVERRNSRRADFQRAGQLLPKSHRPNHPRPADQRAARMPFAADK